MESTAFCPAHITGFFKVHLGDEHGRPENVGSMGAGFSIKHGVTTRVTVQAREEKRGSNFTITINGYQSDKTDVSEFVLDEFLKLGEFSNSYFVIEHDISIPVGYGLGSSSAVALSLSFALNNALQTRLKRTEIGEIAHNAEIKCKTGLGDVLASYYGGFEIRVKPGAPGIGRVEKISTGQISVVVICFSPISTSKFIKEELSRINGLGGEMVKSLLESKNYKHFQDLSLEFARHVGVMTPRMQKIVEELSRRDIKCGVALFGETIFSMVPKSDESKVLEILQKYPGGIVIKSGLDDTGARVLDN